MGGCRGVGETISNSLFKKMTKLSLTWFARAGPFCAARPFRHTGGHFASPPLVTLCTCLCDLHREILRRVRKDTGAREDIQADSLEPPLRSQPGLA